MSMITGQSDKLRKAALIQEEHVHYNMALANDTILSLRYRVRELRAENAKLREYIERKRHLQDFVRLVSENARLREACAELLKMAERHDPEWLYWPEIHDELRELGVEVDT